MKRILFSVLLLSSVCYQSEARTEKYRVTDNFNKNVETRNNLDARVYFSNQVPVAGVAPADNVFYINPEGSFLYVIIDNYPIAINFDKIKVLVYTTTNGVTERVATKHYDIDGSLSYTYIKYNFYSTGNYIFDVFSEDNVFIGTGKVEIRSSNNSTSISNSTPKVTVTGPRVYFSTQVPIAGVAVDVKSFTIPSGSGYVYVIVDNYPNNFDAGSLRVTIYRYENGKYRRQERKIYDINANSYYTYFTHTFRRSGDYKFEVYDSRDRYISTGYVSISW